MDKVLNSTRNVFKKEIKTIPKRHKNPTMRDILYELEALCSSLNYTSLSMFK
jgi:hypothetical protein